MTGLAWDPLTLAVLGAAAMMAAGGLAIMAKVAQGMLSTVPAPPLPAAAADPIPQPLADWGDSTSHFAWDKRNHSPAHTPETHPPEVEDLWRRIAGRPGISLRELCQALWPSLRWLPLYEGEDSAAGRVRPDGRTTADQVHALLLPLIEGGQLRLHHCPGEVDDQAALGYEALEPAPAPASLLPLAGPGPARSNPDKKFRSQRNVI